MAATGDSAQPPVFPAALPPAGVGPEAKEGWVCPEFGGGLFVRYGPERCAAGGEGATAVAGSAHRKANTAAENAEQESWKEAGAPHGAVLSKCTGGLLEVYKKCRAEFRYQPSLNPRRCLTKPGETEGDGFDNKDADLVVYVNDELVSTASGRTYVVVDKLGQGTFGQVVKCQLVSADKDKAAEFAVKIVRNKQAYTNQALVETMMLSLLNAERNSHILKYYECFSHKNHLCLVTELLSVNLYELLKQNQFRGLSLNLIRVVLRQVK